MLWKKADIGSRYSNEGGETAGVQREVARYKRRDFARLKYQQWATMYPKRLVMLCDRATVLARSVERASAFTGPGRSPSNTQSVRLHAD